MREQNKRTLGALKIDPRAQEIWAKTKEEIADGKLQSPMTIDQVPLDDVLLASSFGVVQADADGKEMVRVIDDMRAMGH